ncbi:MAG: helix-turn-helix domain-containing protein [Chloroflexota bacterium]
MSNPSQIYVVDKEKDIPLHAFREVSDDPSGALPFMYFKFSDQLPGSLAAYPHRHSFYEILYITSGNGTHFIDFHPYPIEPNTLYFISPGQVHFWETTGLPIEGEALLFTQDFLLLAPVDIMVLHELSFFHSLEEYCSMRLDHADHQLIEPLIDAISNEYKMPVFRSKSVLRAYIHIFLVQVERMCAESQLHTSQARAGRDTTTQKLVRQFKYLVAKQFQNEQAVSAYAQQLGVTVTHLNNMVKSVTGKTPGRLIRQEIVIEAKRLFAYTDMTAAEVCYRLGFSDPSYFSRFFQREAGVSTLQFRRSLLHEEG